MKLGYKILSLMALLIAFTSCEVERWTEVPVDYTNIYYFRPNATDGEYAYSIYYETSELITWTSQFIITSCNTITDFVDNTNDEDGYYMTFTEIREESVEDEETGEISTQLNNYYFEVVAESNGIGSFTVTDEQGNVSVTGTMLITEMSKTLEIE